MGIRERCQKENSPLPIGVADIKRKAKTFTLVSLEKS
jgi:hypothetical protein